MRACDMHVRVAGVEFAARLALRLTHQTFLFANHPHFTPLDPIYIPAQEVPKALVHQPKATADLETMKLIRSQFYTYLPRLLPVLARGEGRYRARYNTYASGGAKAEHRRRT